MDNKIITNVDANLISVRYDQVTEESLQKNSLLIKELLEYNRTTEKYINRDDIQKLSEYNDISALIEHYQKMMDIKDIYELETLFQQLVSEKSELISELSDQLDINEKLVAKVKQLEAEAEMYKRKYEGQKNRKIVRLVDKVSR